MSVLSRVLAPTADHPLAERVAALLASPVRPAPATLPAAPAPASPTAPAPTLPAAPAPTLPASPAEPPVPPPPAAPTLPASPVGSPLPAPPAAPSPPAAPAAPPATALLTAPRRMAPLTLPRGPHMPAAPSDAARPAATAVAPRRLIGPRGLGSAAARIAEPVAAPADPAVPDLYCPPAIRDDPALGELVNDRLVEWAVEVGIYSGQIARLRSANFGRLMMLAHPESDDPDRLLAAAKCALSEWAVDDHYVDGEVGEARPELLGQRLAIAYAAIDPAYLPERYAPELEQALRDDPVMVALRSGIDNLGRYATAAQVARLRHELAVMFVAYNQEGVWRTTGQTPPVWEYLMHRHENSFLPCMALIDAVAGYELPASVFAEPAVRRAFALAGTASVILNDLYSMTKEDPTDTNLPRLIAAEERCSLPEAVERSAAIHDELVHRFEAEAAALAATGSPILTRFLAGVWAWHGGSREWHRSTERYN